jgi:hypothetical protein
LGAELEADHDTDRKRQKPEDELRRKGRDALHEVVGVQAGTSYGSFQHGEAQIRGLFSVFSRVPSRRVPSVLLLSVYER